jgi:hypothetical protein
VIHLQFGDGDADKRGVVALLLYRVEQAHTSEDSVFAAAKLGEHGAGIGFVARFAEDEAIALGDGVGGEDDS